MRTIYGILLIIGLLALAGCGKTTVGTVALVPAELVENQTTLNASQGNITVKSSLPGQMIIVDANDFKEGLKAAFVASGLFGEGTKRYNIDAEILELDYPSFAGTMEVDYVVAYKIHDEMGEEIATKTLTSKGECPFSEHFVGAVRVMRAVNRSISNHYQLVIDFVAQEISADLAQNTAQ